MKVCIASSAGGHLTELLQIKSVYEKYDHFFITFKRKNSVELAKNEKVYFVEDPSRNPFKLIKTLFQSFLILLKERPKVIISTGAGVAIPIIYLGKLLFRSRIVFIESFCRVSTPSLSGRLAYPIADKFYVQWEELLKAYGRKAEYKGAVI